MKVKELISQLNQYNDDAEVEVRLPGEEPVWHGIVEISKYVPHTPDHALIIITDNPTMF